MRCGVLGSPGAVWDNTEGMRPQLGRFRDKAEYVVWGSKGNMPLGRRAPVLPGVIREAERKVDKHHMTGKPTDVMRQLVRIFEEGGRILDPFAGSGTTLLAAEMEGYSWTGLEVTKHYHDIARSRLHGLKALRFIAGLENLFSNPAHTSGDVRKLLHQLGNLRGTIEVIYCSHC